MFKKLLEDRQIPAGEAVSFLAGLKKESAQIHPVDVSVGALIGGSFAAQNAATRHSTMPSGETPYSNKIRHEMAHHLETRQAGKPPSKLDRLNERLIAGKLRYARLAQEKKNPAIALESMVGAASGAVKGAIIGKNIRSMIAKRASYKAADALGLSRQMLEKKAVALELPVEDVVSIELHAQTLSKKSSLAPDEEKFLYEMGQLQQVITGRAPEPIKRASMNISTNKALLKQSSLGELLIQKEMKKQQTREIPDELAEVASARMEKNDYRAPAREERRNELLGIFGGTQDQLPKQAAVFGAREPALVSSPSGTIDTKIREKALRDYYGQKKNEQSTSSARAGLTGAALGGAFGGMVGLPAGAATMAAGALGGAAIGGLIGWGLSEADKAEIEKAKRRHGADSNELRRIIAAKTEARRVSDENHREYKRDRRHREMVDSIGGVGRSLERQRPSINHNIIINRRPRRTERPILRRRVIIRRY